MSHFTNPSRFRNIEVKLSPRDQWYEQLRVSSISVDGTNGITVNSKFLAYVDSSGSNTSVAVLPLTSTGKNHIPILASAYQQPVIRAHSQVVQDLVFDNWDERLLYTCSTDGECRQWQIPEGGLKNDLIEYSQSFSTPNRFPVKGLAVHPTASGLIVLRGSRDIALINSQTNQLALSLSNEFNSDIYSTSWSFTGDLLCLTTKDKYLRLFDMRAGESKHLVGSVVCHSGSRTSRSQWLGDTNLLMTVGHSSSLDREIITWDNRNLSKSLKRERIDGSTSPIIPLFDGDNNLLVLAGRGDSSMRLYELISSDLAPISNIPVIDMTRGAALSPKQSCDRMKCEVLRVMKLTDSSVQPVSGLVPRKERNKYHEDLYPDTLYGASAASTATEWLQGINKSPIRVSLLNPSQVNVISNSTSETLVETVNDLSVSERSSRASSRFSSNLKYRHVYGKDNSKDNTYYNLSPQTTSDSSSPLIACNDTYWAVPYQGGGGPVYVSSHRCFGKVLPSCAVINGHKSPVQDLAFSPYSNILATGSSDCTVKIWTLPSLDDNDTSNPIQTNWTESDATRAFNSHSQSIRTCNFHPLIPGLLVTSAMDSTVRFFDIEAGDETNKFDLTDSAYVNNLSFSYDGGLISLACKDRVIRIADPRTNSIVNSTSLSNNVVGRNLNLAWCSTRTSFGTILSTSSGSSGLRQIHLWDPRNLSDPTQTISVDNASGQLYPMYDDDTGLCFIAGKGDTILRYYEMSFSSNDSIVFCAKSNEYLSGSREPISGICLMPKRSMDVRNVEVARLLKLTTNSVIPISFKQPRAENLKQYFQDDVFVPTRSKSSPLNVSVWQTYLSDPNYVLPDAIYESLKPDDMTNLSDKPPDKPVVQKATVFREDLNKKAEENQKREETFNRLQDMASRYNPSTSHKIKIKAEAKLVEDSEDSDNDWDN
eukprot:gene19759-25691_t